MYDVLLCLWEFICCLGDVCAPSWERWKREEHINQRFLHCLPMNMSVYFHCYHRYNTP